MEKRRLLQEEDTEFPDLNREEKEAKTGASASWVICCGHWGS